MALPNVCAEERCAAQYGTCLSVSDAPHALVVDSKDVVADDNTPVLQNGTVWAERLNDTAVNSFLS